MTEQKGCNHCRAGVLETVAQAMKRERTDLSAGMKCPHCGAVWLVSAMVLMGDQRQDVLDTLKRLESRDCQ